MEDLPAVQLDADIAPAGSISPEEPRQAAQLDIEDGAGRSHCVGQNQVGGMGRNPDRFLSAAQGVQQAAQRRVLLSALGLPAEAMHRETDPSLVGELRQAGFVVQDIEQALIRQGQVFGLFGTPLEDRPAPVRCRRHDLQPVAAVHHQEPRLCAVEGVGQPGQRRLLRQLCGANGVQAGAGRPAPLNRARKLNGRRRQVLDLHDLVLEC